MNYIMSEYISIVRFLGKVFGDNVEIVLHDTTNVDQSIIAIVNGHISGRTVGQPLTHVGHSFIESEIYKEKDDLVQYEDYSKDGIGRVCHTHFIKNEAGALIGMLCINIDKTCQFQIIKGLQKLFRLADHNPEGEYTDKLEVLMENRVSANPLDSIEAVFHEILAERSLPADRLTYAEKLQIMKGFNDRGIFLLKGSIPEVAKYLKISEATAYRYLTKIERGDLNG